MRRDETAVSEIVGALLLILIVSSAAMAFGVFLQHQQRETQELKAQEAARSEERLAVLGVQPTAGAGGRWDELRFTVASLHTRDSEITGVLVNGMAVRQLDVSRPPAADLKVEFNETEPAPDERLVLAPRQTVVLVLNMTAPHFFGGFTPIGNGQAVEVELVTGRANVFGETFVPPSAVILVDQEPFKVGGSTEVAYVLDGTRSLAVGDGTFLVSWQWFWDATALSGPQARVPDAVATPGAHTISLKVTDSNGLVGAASYPLTL